MPEKLLYESLHTHTNDSDGEATHTEVLEAAEANGFGVVAFTDHDAVLNEERLAQLGEYDGPVNWISGVELSSGLPREKGGGTTSNLHILGLFVNPSNQKLREHCRKTNEARNERMQKIVGNLQELGFRISEKDCLEASGGESVGRPHIVSAVMKHEDNQPVLEKLKTELAEAAKYDDEAARIHQEIEDNPEQLPYKLFLDSEAFKKGVYAEYTYWQDLDSTVELIRNAGGIAIWAHWWTIVKKVDRETLEQIVEDGRVDGLETRFPLERESKDTQENILQEVAETYGCPGITAVDLHQLQSFTDLANRSEEAATTSGLTQQLIETTGVKTDWSNLSS